MSTVERMIYLSSVEPAQLSLRAPAEMETRVEVTFMQQNGTPYAQDPAAQLQLTSRTGNQTTSYAMPSTDVVNGKARVVIPSGDLTDMNGYRLRLLGTVDQQPSLIALGVLRLIESAGMEAVPEDIIDTIDIAMTRGAIYELPLKLWHDEGKTNPYDVSQGISSAVYASQGGPLLVPFTQTVLSYNQLKLSLTSAQVTALPNTCWWTLTASNAAGVTTLVQGNVSVSG